MADETSRNRVPPPETAAETMRARAIRAFGGPERFGTITLPRPDPGEGEILVEVMATSVNPVDYKLRRGDIPALAGPFPVVLHPDIAGVVVATGSGVADVRPGERVFAFSGGLAGRHGALADYVAVDARHAARAPEGLDHAEAAALPLVGVTAWLCLVDVARLSAGQSVLIQGGTGGVGHVAIQIARARGARVFATCGDPERCAIAEGLGAERAFDRTATDAETIVREATDGTGFDVVFNTPGAPSIDHSVACARFGGLILDILGDFPTRPGFQTKWLTFKSVFAGRAIVEGQGRERIGEILRALAAMVEDATLRPLIDPRRFTFDAVAEAHRHAEAGRPVGKVVIARHP